MTSSASSSRAEPEKAEPEPSARREAIFKPLEVPSDDETLYGFRISGRQAKQIFEEHEQDWRSRGWLDAADNMRRYLSGEGGEVRLGRSDLVKFAHVAQAEQANSNRFVQNTFRGRDTKTDIERELPRLKESDPPYVFDDKWDVDLGTLGMGWHALFGDRNFARAYGKNKLKSKGTFTAVRKGDALHIEGDITHSWDEPYDFENGQPGATEARALEAENMAAPFRTKAQWTQKVDAVVPFVGRNRLGEPSSVTWGEIRREPAR